MKYVSIPAINLGDLTKNLTAQYTYNLCAVLPINMKDLTLLQQYLAAWGVEINEANADVDGKAGISMGDLTRSQQYLANWDIELV